ncbi:pirin family protein [Bacillus sp. ISL-47]|uniref:pirin family protein n=1 Tax=Bacillus sp. ISL-47 TaxID=2819130 RepID=UPI001BE98397|nr:pirin family protein [Bacillus sp. ISL-47]MBT2690601.1 pirin family protein [Bacillus sp. ISL-47]MBT2708143.1 pirin family protein [Pseudomonas sp. ISL-84]
MEDKDIYKREIAKVRKVQLHEHSPIHAAGPVIEPGNWERYDPFLLLMEDKFQKGAFDIHPHRGIETVTYVIDGAIEHYDSHSGKDGVLGPGDVQWMTAGSGVVHNEVPSEGVTAHSLQLWINLPRDKKMTAPRYQNLKGNEVPVREEKGVAIRIFSGSSGDVISPTLNHVAVTMIEARMDAGASISQELPGSYKGFIYIIEGSGVFGKNEVRASKGEVLELGTGGKNGTGEIDFTAEEPLRFLLYAGEPVKEPVVARGPFVMNTEEEIQEAYQEYMQGTFLK